MSGKLRIMVLVTAALLLGTAAGAADVVDKGENCSANWTKKEIVCTGKGSPNLEKSKNEAQARLLAEQAAKVDAMRNILEFLKGVKVSAGISVGQVMAADQSVHTEVSGLIKNYTVVATRYFSDGGVEVDVAMPLDGAMTKAVSKKDIKKAEPTTDTTGLIVDASGKSLVPVLAPRILDEQGNVVYGAAMVTETGADNGIVAYHGDVNQAKTDRRVAGNPVVVKAIDVKDAVDVVVSNADAQKIKALDGSFKLLANGRVVFVKN